jgi:hypothetical protein
MKRLVAATASLLFIALVAISHSEHASGQQAGGWTVLFDGKSLDHWSQIGDANWKLESGAAVANKGAGYLVSKDTYTDFQLRVEFWVNDEANSGVFIRCEDPQKVTGTNAYEVNIYDQRPDPTYGTGDRQCRQGRSDAEGRRQVEHL